MLRKLFEKINEKKRKKLLVLHELERLKENFVFKFLLANYEESLRGKVDFGAWWYAACDMRRIKMDGQLDRAYTYAKRILDKECEGMLPWRK